MAAIVVASLVLLGGQLNHWCDGAYERWQLPADYTGGGCAQITPGWHKIFPWNHGNDELVCLGLCPLWTPDD